jgi:hypothetical protein
MPNYKFIYTDLNYQNRTIISLTKENDDGSKEVIRAVIQNENYSRDPRNYLAFGIYPKGEKPGLEYESDQSIYSEELVLNRNESRKPEYRDNPKPAEKHYAKIPEYSPLTAIHKTIMDFLQVSYYPYPVILKKSFFGFENVNDKAGLNGMCDYCQVTNPTLEQIQQVEALFDQCKNLQLFPVIGSPAIQRLFSQPSAPPEHALVPEYFVPPSYK